MGTGSLRRLVQLFLPTSDGLLFLLLSSTCSRFASWNPRLSFLKTNFEYFFRRHDLTPMPNVTNSYRDLTSPPPSPPWTSHICMFVCVFICVCVYIHVRICIYTHVSILYMYVPNCVSIVCPFYVCMCMYACIVVSITSCRLGPATGGAVRGGIFTWIPT